MPCDREFWQRFLDTMNAEQALLKARYEEATARKRALVVELEKRAALEAVFHPRWFWRLWARLGLP